MVDECFKGTTVFLFSTAQWEIYEFLRPCFSQYAHFSGLLNCFKNLVKNTKQRFTMQWWRIELEKLKKRVVFSKIDGLKKCIMLITLIFTSCCNPPLQILFSRGSIFAEREERWCCKGNSGEKSSKFGALARLFCHFIHFSMNGKLFIKEFFSYLKSCLDFEKRLTKELYVNNTILEKHHNTCSFAHLYLAWFTLLPVTFIGKNYPDFPTDYADPYKNISR